MTSPSVKPEDIEFKDNNQPAAADMDQRFRVLLTLISLIKNARQKTKLSELEFLIVNQTFNLVPYRHAALWYYEDEKVVVASASGLVQVDPASPYAQWLAHAIAPQLAKAQPSEKGMARATVLSAANLPEAEAADWGKWMAQAALLVNFFKPAQGVFGGLVVDRNDPFSDVDVALLEDLGDGFAHALAALRQNRKNRRYNWRSWLSLKNSRGRIVMAALILVMLLPVRVSTTAPAEVVARKPSFVSVPFNGTIGEILVTPGQAVKEGDVLARMDSTLLESKTEMAAGDAEAARIALSKTEREAMQDRAKLAELALLQAQVAQKEAERDFSQQLLERAEMKAARDGIVVFSDAGSLRGRPGQTGEHIMLLADPEDSELLIRIPVDAMIDIKRDVPARFFLNVSPLGYREAVYDSIGYQATPDPDGLLTYKVRARFAEGEDLPRIGWTGTAKLYGERTIFAANLLRRPLIALRRKFGV